MTTKPLLVFALEQEAQGMFHDRACLFTGVGKINAAYGLMTYLATHAKPDLIVNLGTAGSAVHKAGSVIHCRRFVQRDMDVTPLGFAPYQTPFSDLPPVLDVQGPDTALPQGICGTGDHFDTAHTGETYSVVDMEAYALAYICHKEQIPFLCLKYISDGADGQAHTDWAQALEAGAQALFTSLMNFYAEIHGRGEP